MSVGKLNLRDRFEWDLNSRDVTPEMFAKQLASDLGVGGEFPIEIANSIREQILAHKQRKIMDEERDYVVRSDISFESKPSLLQKPTNNLSLLF